MTLRQLTVMAEGRQSDEWARTMAIVCGVNNLFADRDGRVNLSRLMPAHLRRQQQQDREPTPAEVEASFTMLRQAVRTMRR